VAVRKAIAAAIDRISDLDSPLARLLADRVTAGTLCRCDQDPDRPATWRLN
jgi:hypothetical protein